MAFIAWGLGIMFIGYWLSTLAPKDRPEPKPEPSTPTEEELHDLLIDTFLIVDALDELDDILDELDDVDGSAD